MLLFLQSQSTRLFGFLSFCHSLASFFGCQTLRFLGFLAFLHSLTVYFFGFLAFRNGKLMRFLSLLSLGFYLLKCSGFGSFALLIFFLALLFLSQTAGSLFLRLTLCFFSLQSGGFLSLPFGIFLIGFASGFLGFLLLFQGFTVSFFLSLAAGAFLLSFQQIFLGLFTFSFGLLTFLLGFLSLGLGMLAFFLSLTVNLFRPALCFLGFLT